MTQQDLIAQAQNGDREAFGTLYEQTIDAVYCFVYHKTLDRPTAEELTSTTFFKALERLPSYKPSKTPFIAWLYTIARHTVIDHYRTLRPNQSLDDAWELRSDEDLAEIFGTKVDVSLLHQALLNLSTQDREVLTLRFWQGYTFPQIAEILHQSESSVKMRLHRSLQKLRDQMPIFLLFSLLLP